MKDPKPSDETRLSSPPAEQPARTEESPRRARVRVRGAYPFLDTSIDCERISSLPPLTVAERRRLTRR
jgi:hypothetical protein